MGGEGWLTKKKRYLGTYPGALGDVEPLELASKVPSVLVRLPLLDPAKPGPSHPVKVSQSKPFEGQ